MSGRGGGGGGGGGESILHIINNNTFIIDLEMDQGITSGPNSIEVKKIGITSIKIN